MLLKIPSTNFLLTYVLQLNQNTFCHSNSFLYEVVLVAFLPSLTFYGFSSSPGTVFSLSKSSCYQYRRPSQASEPAATLSKARPYEQRCPRRYFFNACFPVSIGPAEAGPTSVTVPARRRLYLAETLSGTAAERIASRADDALAVTWEIRSCSAGLAYGDSLQYGDCYPVGTDVFQFVVLSLRIRCVYGQGNPLTTLLKLQI